MNPESPDKAREKLEVRITALILGEASPFEEAELLDAIQNDPQLDAFYREMKKTVKTVATAGPSASSTESVVPPPARLDEARRARLEKLFKQPANKTIPLTSTAERARRLTRTQQWLAMAAALVILFIAIGMLLPALSKAKSKSARIAALNLERERSLHLDSGPADSDLIGPDLGISAMMEPGEGDSDERFLARYGRTEPAATPAQSVKPTAIFLPGPESDDAQADPYAKTRTTDFDVLTDEPAAGDFMMDRQNRPADAKAPVSFGISEGLEPLTRRLTESKNDGPPSDLLASAIAPQPDATVESPRRKTGVTPEGKPASPPVAAAPALDDGYFFRQTPADNGATAAGRMVAVEARLGEKEQESVAIDGNQVRLSKTEDGRRPYVTGTFTPPALQTPAAEPGVSVGKSQSTAPAERPIALGFDAIATRPDPLPEFVTRDQTELAARNPWFADEAAKDASAGGLSERGRVQAAAEPISPSTPDGEAPEQNRLWAAPKPKVIASAQIAGDTVETIPSTGDGPMLGLAFERAPTPSVSLPAKVEEAKTVSLGLSRQQPFADLKLAEPAIAADSTFIGVLENEPAQSQISQGAPMDGTSPASGERGLAGGSGGQSGRGGIRFLTSTNDMSRANVALREHFRAGGVELDSSKMMYFNDRKGTLMVRTTEEELNKIEKMVEELNEGIAQQGVGDESEARSGVKTVRSKLETIKLNNTRFDGLPLSEVVKNLSSESRIRDSDQSGITFAIESPLTDSEKEDFKTVPITGAKKALDGPVDIASAIIKMDNLEGTQSVESVLDAVVAASGNSVAYEIRDNVVVFKPGPNKARLVEQQAARATPPAVPAPLEPRPEVQTADEAFSTFSLNVSDVSFKLAQASLENGQLPDGGQLRSEEFINAFDYHDPAPAPGQKIAFAWEQARFPFAHNRDLLRFSVQTAALGREPGQPLNLVVLLDNSGSMERADRIRISREMLRVLADRLQPNDRISVVSFARTPRLWIDGMSGGNPEELMDRIGRLNPEGGTNLEEALKSAYEIAARHYRNNANNRVILLTDGAANLGNVNPQALQKQVVSERQRGIALDCFGIGWDGYNDSLLEVLSRNGDGRYGFINRPEDAAREFANLLAGSLQVAAADVKAQVEFNPQRVVSYRQIGYLQHQLTKEQFRDNTVDAAEIGAAESGNALYVIQVKPDGSGPLGTVRVRYRVPATGLYEEKEWLLPYTPQAIALDSASPAMRLATSAAAFAEWLAQSPHASEVTLGALEQLMTGVPEVFAPDSRPRELQQMLQTARSLSGRE